MCRMVELYLTKNPEFYQIWRRQLDALIWVRHLVLKEHEVEIKPTVILENGLKQLGQVQPEDWVNSFIICSIAIDPVTPVETVL